MRSRNIKPQIFTNDLLATADPLYTVIFEGLWCYCDREGRCEDRPTKIHLAINPGRAYERTVDALEWLTANEFIVRYQVGKSRYIWVPKFKEHQNPHYKEPPSEIPPPPMIAEQAQGFDHDDSGDTPGLCDDDDSIIGGEASGEPGVSTLMNGGKAGLIPDSGFRIPDSPSQPFPPSRKGKLRDAGENPRALGTNPRANGSNPRSIRNRSLEAWRATLVSTDRVKGTELTWQAVDDELADPLCADAIRAAGGHKAIADRTSFTQGGLESRFRARYEELLQQTPGEER